MIVKLTITSTNIAVFKLGSLTPDLRHLFPSSAWEKRIGTLGEYYRCSFDLSMKFGASELEYNFLRDGNVLMTVNCDYY